IALSCDIDEQAVIEMRDADTLYHIPIALQEQYLDQLACEHLQVDCQPANMEEWKLLVNRVRNLSRKIDIGLVGKYVELPDAYLSVVESLQHAGDADNRDSHIPKNNDEQMNRETPQEA